LKLIVISGKITVLEEDLVMEKFVEWKESNTGLCSICMGDNKYIENSCEIEKLIFKICELNRLTLIVSRCKNCYPYPGNITNDIIKKIYYGEEIWVALSTDAKRKAECLCLKCEKMTGEKATNCFIAQQLYEICIANNMAMMTVECPGFKQKTLVK
jgi:hypothetical protein